MLNLFIDTASKYLTLILEQDDQLIDHLHIIGERKHTEQTIPAINALLAKHHYKLKNVNNFYLTKGPGSYTGVRVGVTIAKTIKTINPLVKVYLITSLLYQVGRIDAVSLLDAKGGKFYFAVVSKGNEVIPSQVLDEPTILEIAKQYPEFPIIKNQLDDPQFDYLNNYFNLKNKFELIKDINEIKPLYLKKAVG
ncbi:tRNA (adenosine(37)-N6)-threonylcarbamoyltransferase complex dimerization subunit type 1 TsaB [Spiroplasma sp. DGKH1]|uniref:tRNA (adenosine(37)-N6)-threonylcarbamoyltransferase complex dimerization subunit type 1 TsaB n=1 Tax=Spiroplasma sp. DGKH1 TaxID=3050074 RepID=UPI0034C66906